LAGTRSTRLPAARSRTDERLAEVVGAKVAVGQRAVLARDAAEQRGLLLEAA